MDSHAPALLDLRWMSAHSGAGRVAQHVLAGLTHCDDPGFRLVLWGDPDRIGDHPDWCEVAATSHAGHERWGQRDLLSLPDHFGGIYLHQVRPQRDWNSTSLIYDTIQLHFGSTSATQQRMRAAYLRRVARRSRHVLTISEHSRRCIQRELGRPLAEIDRVELPMDRDLAERVRAVRTDRAVREPNWRPSQLLFVSRMDPHKNLDGLLHAMGRSRIDRDLPLVVFGARPHERDAVLATARRHGVEQVDVATDTSDDALTHAYADAAAVTMPSFEEGWGLSAWEAIACGIPVVASDRGSLPELAPFAVAPFHSVDVDGPDGLIDALEQVSGAGNTDPTKMNADSMLALRDAPTQTALAAAVLRSIAATRT